MVLIRIVRSLYLNDFIRSIKDFDPTEKLTQLVMLLRLHCNLLKIKTGVLQICKDNNENLRQQGILVRTLLDDVLLYGIPPE